MGFKADTTFIDLEEGGPTKNFKVKTTVPLECDGICSAVTCNLILSIVRPQSSGTGTCLTETDDVVFEMAESADAQPCTTVVTHNISLSGPQEISIPIKAQLDDQYDGTKEFALQMRVPKDPAGQKFLWEDMPLPRVQVS